MTRELAFALALGLGIERANAASISFTGRDQSTGPVAAGHNGEIDYAGATVTLTLENMSPLANGGFITGFLFNVNGNATATLNTGAQRGSQFRDFEAGAALDRDFLGGGSPNAGIAVGETKSFTFDFSGLDAGILAAPFFREISSGDVKYRSVYRAVRLRGRSVKQSPRRYNPFRQQRDSLARRVWSWIGATGLLVLGGLGRRRLKAAGALVVRASRV